MKARLSSEFSISRAKSEDAREIRQLIYNESLHPIGLNWSNFLVIKRRGEIVACGQLRPHGNIKELSSLVVVPHYRREGIGKYLAESLIEQSNTSIYLSGKVELESFYLSLGFNHVSWFDLPSEIKLEFTVYSMVAALRNKPLIFMKLKK